MPEVITRAAAVPNVEQYAVQYDSSGFSVPAYLARPPGAEAPAEGAISPDSL